MELNIQVPNILFLKMGVPVWLIKTIALIYSS